MSLLRLLENERRFPRLSFRKKLHKTHQLSDSASTSLGKYEKNYISRYYRRRLLYFDSASADFYFVVTGRVFNLAT
jgi:hypothetical protein